MFVLDPRLGLAAALLQYISATHVVGYMTAFYFLSQGGHFRKRDPSQNGVCLALRFSWLFVPPQ